MSRQQDDSSSDTNPNSQPDEALIGGMRKRKRAPNQAIVVNKSESSSAQQNETDDGNRESADTAWPDSLHRHLVEAIFDIGLRNASPAVILENMQQTDDENITSERVKSHLQKYRNRKEKSKEEFLCEYDSWMQKARTLADGTARPDPGSIRTLLGQPLYGGDLASFLSYAALYEEHSEYRAGGLENHDPHGPGVHQMVFSTANSDMGIPVPSLTEEERKSPLGVSITHVVGLVYSLSQVIADQRAQRGHLQAGLST